MNSCFRILSFGCLFLIGACSNPNEVGLALQPKGEKPAVLFVDTIAVQAQTVWEDSLVTSQAGFDVVGSYNDEIFGQVNAGFASEFSSSISGVSIPSTAEPDSAVLTLAYAGFYGDTSKSLTLNIYRLTEDLLTTTPYYSSREPLHNAAADWSITLTKLNIRDSVTIDGTNRAPLVRIKLDKSYAQDMLNATRSDTTFKGLYFDAALNKGPGCLAYFSPSSDQTKITLYYKLNGVNTTISYYSNTSSGRYNYFPKVLTYPGLKGPLSSAQPDSLLYMQGLARYKLKLKFPYIRNLNGMDIAINRAELLIPEFVTPSAASYKENFQLIVAKITDDQNHTSIIPDQFEGAGFYGGAYNGTLYQYSFNVTRYVQSLIKSSTTDYGMFVISSNSVSLANRVVLAGPNKKVNPLKLRLTYTKVH